MSLVPNIPPASSNAPPPPWITVLFTKPPVGTEIEYYAAFGKFIAAYALAESSVHIAVRHFSSMTEDKARVVFGDARLTNLAWFLRQFTAKTTDHAEADYLLTQLEIINKERSKFVHRLVKFDPQKGFQVTNRLTVKSAERLEQHTFSKEELKAMEDDCNAIFFRLCVLAGQFEEAKLASSGITLAGMHAPWRYTPPRPKREEKARRANRRSRKRQRHGSLM